MGKGLALEFKQRYPEMFEDFKAKCDRKEVRLGRPYLYKRTQLPWILNFPTKDHWRGVSKLSAIEEGLRFLAAHYKQWGIESLAVPPLGCGLGQLDWDVVGPTLYRGLRKLDIPVELYAPMGTPPEQLTLGFLQKSERPVSRKDETKPKPLSAAMVALVAAIDLIERRKHHYPIGRTSFQKLAYFATQSGIPTGFEHTRNSYGPFASEVKPALTRLVNNGLVREEKLGKMLAVRPGPTYRDAAKVHRDRLREWKPNILRLVDLFARMNTKEAELAATVVFVANELQQNGSQPTELDVFTGVKSWKIRRRPPIDDGELAEAVRELNAMRWVGLRYSPELPVPQELL
jgi:uncharacterized protein YwgA